MTIPGVTAVEVAGCRLRSVGKVSYVAENEAILRRIPHFPSARLSRSYSIGETALDSAFRRRAASLYISELNQARGTWIVAVDHAAYTRLRK